jgi:hypothetical protein
MKPQFNKTWLIIAVIVIGNIIIFSFMSRKLESYVADSMLEKTDLNLQGLKGI